MIQLRKIRRGACGFTSPGNCGRKSVKYQKSYAESAVCTGKEMVSVFDIDEDTLQGLSILSFDSANREWLRYISANRTGHTPESYYDVIIGPVANDQTIRTINNYLRGYFSEEIAIQLLLPQKLKDQYTFKSERALELLRFMEVK